jgi:hypothetical protein
MTHLRRSILKKFEDEPSEEANERALTKFLAINERCRTFSLDLTSASELETTAVGEAKDFLYRFFNLDQDGGVTHLLNMVSITDEMDLGPGANIGAPSPDFLSKVGTSTMTATSEALLIFFEQAVRRNPLWSDVEFIRSVVRGNRIVPGSRLTFVPKTTEISRTICTEPLVNMFFQKGIGKTLERQLRRVIGIDLSIQPDKNQTLARLGSESGKFGTIDLSSASDSMSIALLSEILPSQVMNWLMRTRSPVTALPGGEAVELHMVSSMGNAYTFPLQTLLFASLVYGAYRVLGIPFQRPFRHNLGNFAVFGDDIICLKQAYSLVCRLLVLFGFEVNVDKSFNDGFFRESCGRDYYSGHDVRGVYIKHLRDECDRYSAINRLNVWSASHGIPLPSLCSYLLKGLRLMPVPFDEMDTAGVKVHSSHLRRKRFCRWTSGTKYRYIHIEERSVSVSDVVERPPRLKGWINNPPAVLLAALAGTLRSGKVVTRTSRRSTRVRHGVTPRWDYIRVTQGVSPDFGSRWKTAVELNLEFS